MSKRATKTTQPDNSADDGGMDWARFDVLTDAEITAAAAADPDCSPPMTPERLARVRQVAVVKFVRMKLAMSREAFAAAYAIPVDTITAWERHEAEPDDVALAYLRAIERNPEVNKLVPA